MDRRHRHALSGFTGALPAIRDAGGEVGYDRTLRRMLVPLLGEQQVGYILSGDFAPASDPGVFLPDGHFRPVTDAKMAEGLLAILPAGAR